MQYAVIAIAILAFSILIISIIDFKYKNFIRKHSLALQTLIILNQKYFFHTIPSFDLSNYYDNKIYFDSISTKDYLIYQLVYIQKDVRKAIDITLDNRRIFSLYQEEIKRKCVFGQYDTEDLPKNLVKLSRIEKKLFDNAVFKPVLDFTIKVYLCLNKINGVKVWSKTRVFNTLEIETILELLKQKSGDFYKDEEIWKSICRVERAKVSNKMRFAIYNRDNYRCKMCGRKTNDLEIDHIFPVSKGGKSTFDNLQMLCHKCNAMKSNIVVPGAVAPNSRRYAKGEICDVCGAPLILKSGKYGNFYGCTNYPHCKFTKKPNDKI